jgi:enoyl-CoA hydratase
MDGHLMAGTVEVRTEGAVAVLRVVNPPLNLLTMSMRAALQETAEAIRGDGGIRAVVLESSGERAFCAGSDIREFPVTPQAGRERAIREHACYDAIAGLPQPVVAGLFGHVLGAGLELALACDLRVADESTHLGLPEVKLGVFPSGAGTQRLPRVVPPSTAKRMMFLGEVLDSATASHLGLVDEVVGPGQAPAQALRLAQQIAEQPALSVQAIKRAVDHGLAYGTRAGQALEVELITGVFTSRDAQEGVQAFLGSRAPRFVHG